MPRRHLTAAVTLVVLVGILVLGAWVGMRNLFAPLPGDDDPSAAPAPACATQAVRKGQRLHSRQVVVSVYNAGSRAGLADDTYRALRKRGFKKGDVGNSPVEAEVRFVQVWTTQKNDAAARLVARQFGRKTKLRVVKDEVGPGIDVLVGNDFKGLVKADRSIKVTKRQQVCVS